MYLYKMQRFRVIDAKRSYRAVECQFMIDITVHIIIEEKADFPPDFPMYAYRLTRFADLSALAGETRSFVGTYCIYLWNATMDTSIFFCGQDSYLLLYNTLLDIMGIITEVTALEHVHLQNQGAPTVRRCLTLRDGSNYEMKLFLWGRWASEFDVEYVCKISHEKPVVVVFVGLLVKTFPRDTCLSGNSSSRWYINAAIPEVERLIQRVQNDFQPIIASAADNVASPMQQPVSEPEFKTLEESKAISPYDFPNEGFCCAITVSRINQHATWFFASCNRCNKACFPDDSGYKCGSCTCTSSKFKYKICLFGIDRTAKAEFVFFGELGRCLLGRDINTVMRTCSRAGDTQSQIAAVVGQKYQLTINVTGRAFQKAVHSYQVKSIDSAYGRQPIIPQITASQGTGHQPHSGAGTDSDSKRKQPMEDQYLPQTVIVTKNLGAAESSSLGDQTPAISSHEGISLTSPPQDNLLNPLSSAAVTVKPTEQGMY